MKFYILALILILNTSCSQRDIVEDYQRRIASVYSYSLNKINSRNAIPFINEEYITLDKCKNNLDVNKSECINKYYNLLLLDSKIKYEQLGVFIDILKGDLEQYKILVSDFKIKIDELKNKNVTANTKHYQKLLKSLDKDYEYYKSAGNIFADHLNTLPEQFNIAYSNALKSIQSISSKAPNTQKVMFIELENSIVKRRVSAPAHPLIAYRSFVNQLYRIANKKIPDIESSKEYSNLAHNEAYYSRHLLLKIKKSGIQNNIYSSFARNDYNKIILGVWKSINNILLKNQTFTHLTLLHAHYTGNANKFVNYVPVNTFCERLKKSTFHEVNIPWSDEYLDLFYTKEGVLSNGVFCRRHRAQDTSSLDFGKNIGAKIVANNKRLDVIYEHKGTKEDFLRHTTKVFSPPPKMLSDEILKAINIK